MLTNNLQGVLLFTVASESPPVQTARQALPLLQVHHAVWIDKIRMSASARPRVVQCILDHSRADWVPINVPQHMYQVRVAQGTGEKSILPYMSSPIQRSIQVLRVLALCPTHHESKRILFRRNEDHMDMIRHQTVTKYSNFVLAALESERIQVEALILVGREHDFLIVSPLSDMVRHIGQDYPSTSWHISILT